MALLNDPTNPYSGLQLESNAHCRMRSALRLLWLMFCIHIKGADEILLLMCKCEHKIYKKGDVVLVGAWLNRYKSEWKTGTVTELVSPQTVCMDGVPCHIKETCSFLHSWSSSVENETVTLGDDG